MKRFRTEDLESCEHEVVIYGLCTVCGSSVSQSSNGRSVSLHASIDGGALYVSRKAAKKLADAEREQILKHERLRLVLDLDHTILHCVTTHPQEEKFIHYFPELVSPRWKGVPAPFYQSTVNKSVFTFVLPNDSMYDIHVYTAAIKTYADVVVRIIDPDGSIIGRKAVAKEIFVDNQAFVKKNKELRRIFPLDTSFAVAVDDLPLQWTERESVIAIEPFSMKLYTPTVESTASARQSEPVQDNDTKEDESEKRRGVPGKLTNNRPDGDKQHKIDSTEVPDRGLQSVSVILTALHDNFKQAASKHDWNVKEALQQHRRSILRKYTVCIVVDSQRDKNALEALAKNLGARVVANGSECDVVICNTLAERTMWSLQWQAQDPSIYRMTERRRPLQSMTARAMQLLHAPLTQIESLGEEAETLKVDVRQQLGLLPKSASATATTAAMNGANNGNSALLSSSLAAAQKAGGGQRQWSSSYPISAPLLSLPSRVLSKALPAGGGAERDGSISEEEYDRLGDDSATSSPLITPARSLSIGTLGSSSESEDEEISKELEGIEDQLFPDE